MCLQRVEAVPALCELREKPEENRQMKQQERYGGILSLLLHGSHFCLFRHFLKPGIAHFFLLNQRQQEGQRHERENTSHSSAAQAHLLVPTEASMHWGQCIYLSLSFITCNELQWLPGFWQISVLGQSETISLRTILLFYMIGTFNGAAALYHWMARTIFAGARTGQDPPIPAFSVHKIWPTSTSSFNAALKVEDSCWQKNLRNDVALGSLV